MKVKASGTLPITQPFRSTNGITISWRTGDIVQPLDFWSGRGWFSDAEAFREVYWSYTRIPLPFVTMRLGWWGFCFGAKGFGVDSESYKRWLPEGEIFEGSQAIMLFTFRMTTTLK